MQMRRKAHFTKSWIRILQSCKMVVWCRSNVDMDAAHIVVFLEAVGRVLPQSGRSIGNFDSFGPFED